MLNFDQFINESREGEFNSLEKGDIVLHRGFRFEVKSILKNKEGMVDTVKIAPIKRLDDSTHSKSLSLAQFKQQVSGVIKKEKTKDENED
jgi:hypothetical protein